MYRKYKNDNDGPPEWRGYGRKDDARCTQCWGCLHTKKCIGDKRMTTKEKYEEAYEKLHTKFAIETVQYWRDIVKQSGAKTDMEPIVIPEEIRITEDRTTKRVKVNNLHAMKTRGSEPPPKQRLPRSRARSPTSSSSSSPSPSPSPSPSSLPRLRSPSPPSRASSFSSLPSSSSSSSSSPALASPSPTTQQKSAGNFDMFDSLRQQLLTANDTLQITRRELEAEKREKELDKREREVEKREMVEERRKFEEERRKFEEEKRIGEEERINLKRRVEELEKENEELRVHLRQEGHPQFLQELNLL